MSSRGSQDIHQAWANTSSRVRQPLREKAITHETADENHAWNCLGYCQGKRNKQKKQQPRNSSIRPLCSWNLHGQTCLHSGCLFPENFSASSPDLLLNHGPACGPRCMIQGAEGWTNAWDACRPIRGPGSTPGYSYFRISCPKGSTRWLKFLGSCHSQGRTRWNSRLLALSWYSPKPLWALVGRTRDGWSISLCTLILYFSLCQVFNSVECSKAERPRTVPGDVVWQRGLTLLLKCTKRSKPQGWHLKPTVCLPQALPSASFTPGHCLYHLASYRKDTFYRQGPNLPMIMRQKQQSQGQSPKQPPAPPGHTVPLQDKHQTTLSTEGHTWLQLLETPGHTREDHLNLWPSR